MVFWVYLQMPFANENPSEEELNTLWLLVTVSLLLSVATTWLESVGHAASFAAGSRYTFLWSMCVVTKREPEVVLTTSSSAVR